MAKDFHGFHPVKRPPKCFRGAYDDGDTYADRYTVLFGGEIPDEDGGWTRGMSRDAMQPNGVNMYIAEYDDLEYEMGTMDEIADRVKFSKLPNQVQRAILSECRDLGEEV